MKNRMRGYSLVEFVFSTSIAMLLSAVSFPSVTTSLETYRLRNDARKIVAQSQNARFRAVSSNMSHRLHFNGTTLEVQRRTGVSYTTVEATPLASGIRIQSAWSQDPVFSPRGSVSPAASVTLTNGRGMLRTVSISVLGLVTEQ